MRTRGRGNVWPWTPSLDPAPALTNALTPAPALTNALTPRPCPDQRPNPPALTNALTPRPCPDQRPNPAPLSDTQIYVGPEKRSYIPVDYRPTATRPPTARIISSFSKRSRIATYNGKKETDRLLSNL